MTEVDRPSGPRRWNLTSAAGRIRRSPLVATGARAFALRLRRPRLSQLRVGDAALPGKRVLFATSVGGFLNGLTLEATLAAALRARGHAAEAILCDSLLPACMECTMTRMGSSERMADSGPRGRLCPGCFRAGSTTYDEIGVPVHRLSALVTSQDRARAQEVAAAIETLDVQDLIVDGLRIGEHALAGTLRFFARATLEAEPAALALSVLRRYVEAAVLTAFAFQRLLRSGRFESVVFHHGIYVPQGIVGEVCRAEGVRVVNWNPGYRATTFVFSHQDTYHHTLLDEPTETWEKLGWDDQRESEVMDYLQSRASGANDWIWFHQHAETSHDEVVRATGIDPAKPCIGLLTNVMWDAQLHYPANAFSDMREWLLETVAWFAEHPELQLIVRVHPAEVTGSVPSRQRVVDELKRAFDVVPSNVHLVGPDNPLSTYAAMQACDSVIIYGTKTGVELSAMGIPVIVAGEAWIRGKGVARDVSSKADYFDVLASLPRGERLDEATTRRARQYAYHFFFRRMVPLSFMTPTGTDPVFMTSLSSAQDMRAGADAGLDLLLNGILDGEPFVYLTDRDRSALRNSS